MLRMILELIANAAGAVSNWFKWKSSGVAQREAAEGIVERNSADSARRRAEVNRACHEGDAGFVNRILNSVAAVSLASLCVVGCASAMKPQYVAADREVRFVTNSVGRAVFEVPPLVMEELLNAKLELGEIKKENKIKEIAK